MDNSVGDNGVPPDPGIQGGIRRPFEQALRLLQSGPQTDADTQQPVPGWLSPAGKDLVEVHFAHTRPAGQGGFGDGLGLVQGVQQISNAAVHKLGPIFPSIGVQIGLLSHLPLQIAGGLVLHPFPPFDFRFQIVYTEFNALLSAKQ